VAPDLTVQIGRGNDTAARTLRWTARSPLFEVALPADPPTSDLAEKPDDFARNIVDYCSVETKPLALFDYGTRPTLYSPNRCAHGSRPRQRRLAVHDGEQRTHAAFAEPPNLPLNSQSDHQDDRNRDDQKAETRDVIVTQRPDHPDETATRW
jgi:hypothetical protein